MMRTARRPVTAPLFGSQPRRPSCVCSGLEPHCRTSRCARPQPTPSPRCCSLTSLLGTANCTFGTATAVLPTAAPDHCGPPGTVASRVAVLQPLWLRDSTTAPSCELHLHVLPPGSSCLPGPAVSLGYERTITTPQGQCLLRQTQISARSTGRQSASNSGRRRRRVCQPVSAWLTGHRLGNATRQRDTAARHGRQNRTSTIQRPGTPDEHDEGRRRDRPLHDLRRRRR